ncbi:MAG: ATP-dependent helicase, partial [Bacteroides sp.]|nr:ATP-dependent helicase [Bacteroides sp.]
VDDEDKPEKPNTPDEEDHVIEVKGLPTLNEKTKAIVENDLDTLVATTLSDKNIREAIIGEGMAEMITEVYIPKIIRETYPDLNEDEVDAVAKHTILTIATQGEQVTVDDSGNRFIKIANKFVNLNDLDINLIAELNPFQRAYEVVSKSLTPEVLRTIQYAIEDKRSEKLTDEEAILLFTKYLPKWREENPGKTKPEITDGDPLARRIAMAIEHLRNLRRQRLAQQQ